MKDVLIIYLGSMGGGILDTYEICRSLCHVKKNLYSISIIISENNPFREKYKNLPLKNCYVIKTHRKTLISFIFHSIFFIRIGIILKIIRKINPSIVLFTMEHPWLLIISFYLKKFMPKTHVIYIKHNPPNFDSQSSKFLNKLLDYIDMKLLHRADYIFTLSGFVKEQIIKEFRLPEDKLYGFTFGVHQSICDNWRHSGFWKDGILKLLFFGRILEYKGIDILVEAHEIIKRNKLPVQLTIAGDGFIEAYLLKKIRELNIKLKNYWLSNEEICHLLSETDVVILPYKRASQSGPASIALALRIPVIATQVGGLAEQVRDGVNGILIKPNCPDEIVKAVYRILEEPSLLNSFRDGALLLKNQLSWDNVALDMDRIFCEKLYE